MTDTEQMLNHLMRLHLDLVEKYNALINRMRLQEKMAEVKAETKAEPPKNTIEAPAAPPKRGRGRPRKEPAEAVRVRFDSEKTSDASS